MCCRFHYVVCHKQNLSAAKILQLYDIHFILRVKRFNLSVKCFNLGVKNFRLGVNAFILRVKFYSACIVLIYSFGVIFIIRLKICEKELPDVNPDSIATCSSFNDVSFCSISHACSIRRVFISL